MIKHKYKVGDKVKLVNNFFYSGHYISNDTGHQGFNLYEGKTFTINSLEYSGWRGNDGVDYPAYTLEGTTYRWAEPMFEPAFDIDKIKEELAKEGYRVIPVRSGTVVIVEYENRPTSFTKKEWDEMTTKSKYKLLTTVDWTEEVK